MATRKPTKNNHLEEAVALLIQNQAAFLERMASMDRELVEQKRENAVQQRENAERFARIEAILLEHTRLLRALPETIRQKIGFKPAK
jgi:transposase